MNQSIRQQFLELLGVDRALFEEQMSRHTTFRIGGPADYYLMPENIEEIKKILIICKENQIPYFVVGNGSNLLVGDKGYRGAILQIYRNLNQIGIHGNRIVAQAGVLLSTLASQARAASLTGAEFAGGIPGTLGGAVFMNAGAYGGEMRDILKEVTILTSEGEVVSLPAEELELGYRHSIFQRMNWIILDAVLELQPGREEDIRETMRELSQRRIDKQPLEYPSAGSTFKRPAGHFAGKLIMDAGLRGYQVGGAQVSEKHCGFVINVGDATASDVRTLMDDVNRIVREQFEVSLEPEVKFLGEF